MSRFTCPVCGAPLKDSDALAPGERGHCDACGPVLQETAGEPPGRLRKKRKKKSPGSGLRVALLLSGGLLLSFAVILTLIILFRGDSVLGLNFGGNQKVTRANLDKLWAAMTLEQAQAILGDGKPCDAQEIQKVCDASFDAFHKGAGGLVVLSGTTCGVESWHRWQNGRLHAFAGFRKSKSGVPRLVLLEVLYQGQGGVFGSEERIMLLQHQHADPNSLDLMAADHARREKLLDDPKWKTGAAIRKSLIGHWRLPGSDPVNFHTQEGFDFNADGSCARTGGPGGRYPGKYRFLDDAHIEVTNASEFRAAGDRPWTRSFRVLVNDRELILVHENPSGPELHFTLERR
jgi:hypothetical protein